MSQISLKKLKQRARQQAAQQQQAEAAVVQTVSSAVDPSTSRSAAGQQPQCQDQ